MGARALGLDPVGVELDAGACATRDAAGLRTVRGDVSLLDPLAFAPCDLLIGSPPCPTFSTAGSGHGHDVTHVILAALADCAAGRDTRAARAEEARLELLGVARAAEAAKAARRGRAPDERRAEARAARDAALSLLVVEPLRWALELRPRWIALEQVPPVLPIWQALAAHLEREGWRCWTGELSSEQFGVPQTRRRAILLADRERRPCPPAPTHQRYVPPPKETGAPTLFDPGPRGRIVRAGEERLAPWVSMAEALGWDADGRVGFPRRNDLDDGGDYRERDYRDAEEPAPSMTEKARSWQHEVAAAPAPVLCGHHTPRWAYRQGNTPNATVRDAAEPAPTVLFGHRANEVGWVQRERSGDRSEEGFDPAEGPAQALTSKARSWTVRTGTNSMSDSRDPGDMTPYERPIDAPAPTLDGKAGTAWRVAADGDHVDPPQSWKLSTGRDGGDQERDADDPAPTVGGPATRAWSVDRPAPTIVGGRRSKDGMLAGRQLPEGEGENVGGWGYDRPSTTMQNDPRVFHPGGHVANDGRDNERMVGRSESAIRISASEASVLQGFPADYPWQGSRTKQFEQVGNAVPPPLARAILAALLGGAP